MHICLHSDNDVIYWESNNPRRFCDSKFFCILGFITSFCTMMELLHELKNSGCYRRSMEVFDNVSAGKRKTDEILLDFYA